jgi:hypothetical protein
MKHLVFIAMAIVLVLTLLCCMVYFMPKAFTQYGHFIITANGKEIHAVKIIRASPNHFFFVDRDGNEGHVCGTFTVVEVTDENAESPPAP